MRTGLRDDWGYTGASVSAPALGLGVSTPSASSLEPNDDRGVAKLEREAREIAEEVAWTMALEAQDLSGSDIEQIVIRLVARKVATLQ